MFFGPLQHILNIMLFEMHLTREIISVLKFWDVHYPKRNFKVVY